MEHKNKEENTINLDLLKQVEELSSKVNNIMASKTKTVFHRYPVTFALLILFAIVAIDVGFKEIIHSIEFFEGHPWRIIIIGLVILIATGTLYKKLNKHE